MMNVREDSTAMDYPKDSTVVDFPEDSTVVAVPEDSTVVDVPEDSTAECAEECRSMPAHCRAGPDVEEMNKLKKELAELQLKICSLEQQVAMLNNDGTLVWRISDFSRRLEDARSNRNVSFDSMPFYTNKEGYKMCARIFLDGIESSRHRHISLFLVLQRGHFDAILEWPFRQNVTLSILNQNSRKDDVIEHLSRDGYPAADSVNSPFRRPKADTSASNERFGCLAMLGYEKLYEEHGFVKENTLFVKVVVHPIGQNVGQVGDLDANRACAIGQNIGQQLASGRDEGAISDESRAAGTRSEVERGDVSSENQDCILYANPCGEKAKGSRVTVEQDRKKECLWEPSVTSQPTPAAKQPAAEISLRSEPDQRQVERLEKTNTDANLVAVQRQKEELVRQLEKDKAEILSLTAQLRIFTEIDELKSKIAQEAATKDALKHRIQQSRTETPAEFERRMEFQRTTAGSHQHTLNERHQEPAHAEDLRHQLMTSAGQNVATRRHHQPKPDSSDSGQDGGSNRDRTRDVDVGATDEDKDKRIAELERQLAKLKRDKADANVEKGRRNDNEEMGPGADMGFIAEGEAGAKDPDSPQSTEDLCFFDDHFK